MSLRFRRSIKIIPGLRLNLSKSGPSISFGVKGLTRTVSARGTRTTVGIPGTGLSQSEFVAHEPRQQAAAVPTQLTTADKLYKLFLVTLGYSICAMAGIGAVALTFQSWLPGVIGVVIVIGTVATLYVRAVRRIYGS